MSGRSRVVFLALRTLVRVPEVRDYSLSGGASVAAVLHQLANVPALSQMEEESYT